MATDFNALRLKYHGNEEKLDEILQQECRYKCAKKLRHTLEYDSFRFSSLALAEMSTSDDVAEIHASMVDAGSRVLDMTAGLGIDAFHMARNGSYVTAIELNGKAAAALRHNVECLGLLDSVTIIEGDSVEWLNDNPEEHFDVIFVDPARRDGAGRHFSFSKCQPDLTRVLPMLTSRCTKLIIKASPMIDVKAAKDELGLDYCNVTIIGTPTECKEVVLTVGGSHNGVSCVTVGRGSYHVPVPTFPVIATAQPRAGQWLMQPYPAVMKGTGGEVDGFVKLHPLTHIYIADSRAEFFPGLSYVIEDVMPFNKATIKDFSKHYPKVNVVTRNFPLSAPELAKKLKIKEGGDRMTFGVTLHDGSRALIVTRMGE